MKLTIVAASAAHQQHWAACLATGIRRHGWQVEIISSFHQPATEFVACWGWKRGQMYRAQGKQVLVMERGYVGDRFKWTSLGWNGLNGKADFCLSNGITIDGAHVTEADGPRFQSRFRCNFGSMMKPWKSAGSYVLVLGQVPGDASLAGKDLRAWYREAAEAVSKIHGLPARFRPHPVAVRRGIHRPLMIEECGGTLEDALAGAEVAVTWNSNSAVDAVLAGVPTITMDQGSMAWDVTGHEFSSYVRPDRSAWAARLAWCQWTAEEMEAGLPWEFLGSYANAQAA